MSSNQYISVKCMMEYFKADRLGNLYIEHVPISERVSAKTSVNLNVLGKFATGFGLAKNTENIESIVLYGDIIPNRLLSDSPREIDIPAYIDFMVITSNEIDFKGLFDPVEFGDGSGWVKLIIQPTEGVSVAAAYIYDEDRLPKIEEKALVLTYRTKKQVLTGHGNNPETDDVIYYGCPLFGVDRFYAILTELSEDGPRQRKVEWRISSGKLEGEVI